VTTDGDAVAPVGYVRRRRPHGGSRAYHRTLRHKTRATRADPNRESSMQVTLLDSAQLARKALHELSEWAEGIEVAVAWASSGAGTAPHWTGLDRGKIRRALVGIHFYQTEPAVLDELRAFGVLKVIAEPTGVFHPKLVLGRSGDQLRALVGSSNLTAGGFGVNTELGVLIGAPVDHPESVRLLGFMDELWSRKTAIAPDDAWMGWYTRRYRERPKPRAVSGPVPFVAGPPVDVRCMDWSGYFSSLIARVGHLSVHGDELRVFERQWSYRAEIRNCRRAFRDHVSFKDMPAADRALVGGFGGGSSGYFGHMGSAIQFRDLVKNRPEDVAAVLDELPRTGRVAPDVVEDVAARLLQVTGIGMPSGTRLLTVKRPDLYFPVNKANSAHVHSELGQLRFGSPHAVADYLAILKTIRESAWWQAPRPDDISQRRAWRARVGLLDVLLYSG